MVPPLPPSSSDPAASPPAGGEDMDFDALDFSFLDGEEPALSAEDHSAKSDPAPAAAAEALAAADGAADDFDLAAWDAAEPTAEPDAPPAVAPVAAAPVEDLGLEAEFSLDAEAEHPDAEAALELSTDDDPFADLRSPEPDAPALTKGTDNPLAVSFGDADFNAEDDEFAAPEAPMVAAETEAALFAAPDEGDFGLEADSEMAFGTDDDTGDDEPAAPKGPRKYLFDRSFDYVPPPPPPPEPEPEPEIEEEPVLEMEPEPEPEPEPEEPPPPPPPTFSEEELAAARASSYADGETAGLQAAMATVEARGSRALEAIAQQVPGLLADRQQLVTNVAHEAARLAYALVARMMPELARTYGLGEIEAVVRDSLSMAIDQPRITVRVQPEIAELLHPKLEGMALNAGFNGHISLLADGSLGPSDVRVDWGDGGAERLIQRAWNDVTEIVRRSVADLKERTGAGIADESAVVQGYETASL